MYGFRRVLAGLGLTIGLLFGAPAGAQTADIGQLVTALATGSFDDKEKAIVAIAASGNPRAAAIIEALGAGTLYVRKIDARIVIATPKAGGLALADAATGAAAGEGSEAELDRVRVNNRLRRAIEAAVGSLTLMSPDPKVRREAAAAVFKSRDATALAALESALAAEKDPSIRATMRDARAAVLLGSDASEAQKLEAVAIIRERGDREALSLLRGSQEANKGAIGNEIAAAIRSIEQNLQLWQAAQNVWYGVSLGSVLLLAAIGLAITFGTMGVINMAHGEMVMIGAYTTFVVQEVVRARAPELAGASLLLALPAAFVVTAAVGVAIERGIIRFLYGRPLDTLLATFGLSLMLQQAVRSIFGPTNREVSAPGWMSGAFELGQLTITYGRAWIVVFAILVFVALNAALKRTSFGLKIRAVTQNRRMAGAMGIRAPWVDAMTFGLGSGIAGIAGVALTQIDNVSPNLGQGYIIDSFLVVVFGGVGNLAGTLVGALSLGILNKFLEPFAGAVLGKIVVLVLIILFIQKRPRGLFAQKGRAVES